MLEDDGRRGASEPVVSAQFAPAWEIVPVEVVAGPRAPVEDAPVEDTQTGPACEGEHLSAPPVGRTDCHSPKPRRAS